MKVAIHQPHFLPWLGYLDRMKKADLFIILDHVQFERRNYQNRTQIRVEDEGRWLSVPVVQLSQKERIIEKKVDNPPEGTLRWWGPNAFQTLRYAYRKAPFFDQYAPRLKDILERRWSNLVDLNDATLEFMRESFDICTPLVKSSELRAEGHRSELLLNLCKEVGGKTFLGGLGGSRGYLNLDAFREAGIDVEWQQFPHPRYVQCGSTTFIQGLSAVDALFNCGPDARDLLGERRPIHADERLAA
ncbi:MAG: WbqC family protein [Bacillota bacterium]